MLGELYGDLPPPSDEDKPTNTTTTVWSIFAPPQTILKPQSKPKTTQNSLPTRLHSSPVITPSPDDVVALPQPALVDATSTVIKEHDPARPNYDDYRREKKKKEVDAEISRELERRMQEEEEREMREMGASTPLKLLSSLSLCVCYCRANLVHHNCFGVITKRLGLLFKEES
ncbi:DNA-damage-repair/toleration protein DRT111 [Citrus sinensis]|nr:DNA-damage-repair/toleration protein DRT111 [Citrus sinensis]